MEGEGFEPSKAEPSDLQSDPFGRSGTPPKNQALNSPSGASRCQLNQKLVVMIGASGRSRTDDLLITNQLLYQLSYASNQCSSKPVANSMQYVL